MAQMTQKGSLPYLELQAELVMLNGRFELPVSPAKYFFQKQQLKYHFFTTEITFLRELSL